MENKNKKQKTNPPLIHNRCRNKTTPNRSQAMKKSKRENISRTTVELWADLPKHIIVKILLHLPVKSLLRFRSVCKSWLALFADPVFAKQRFLGTRRLVFSSFQNPPFSLKYIVNYDNDDKNNFVTLKVPREMLRNQPLQLLGTCNGLLLCILNGKELFLLNPTTRVLNKILHPPFKQDDAFVFYGLGYDSSSDFDYKVVRGVCDYEYFSGERRDVVEIYSRNTDSWKRIENFPYKDIVQVSGVLVEGALHWLVIVEMGVNGGLRYAIGSLDLGEEKFREVPLPENSGEGNYIVHLGVLEGFLCVVSNHYGCGTPRWTIWVMKEYNVKGSWKKLMAIPPLLSTGIVVPLCVTKRGEVVMQVGKRKIVKYDPRSRMFKKVMVANFEIESATYVQSFELPLPPQERKKEKAKETETKMLPRI